MSGYIWMLLEISFHVSDSCCVERIIERVLERVFERIFDRIGSWTSFWTASWAGRRVVNRTFSWIWRSHCQL